MGEHFDIVPSLRFLLLLWFSVIRTAGLKRLLEQDREDKVEEQCGRSLHVEFQW